MFSFREFVFGGRFQITQCTKVPEGASGSSTTRAKAAVPAGAPLHSSAGEMSAPLQEYCVGIAVPDLNAVLVRVKPVELLFLPPDCWATAAAVIRTSRAASLIKNIGQPCCLRQALSLCEVAGACNRSWMRVRATAAELR